MTAPPSKVVFVGNIPFDKTEEDLADLFRQAGPLDHFRLVMDKESLKPKGYGFAYYLDVDTAKSAVRNLNDSDISGRKLRVNFADEHVLKSQGIPPPEAAIPTAADIKGTSTTGGHAGSFIAKVVDTMSLAQKLEVLVSIKQLMRLDPNQARDLLTSNPQLAYSAMLMMSTEGMVDTESMKKIVAAIHPNGPATNPPFQAPQQQFVPPQQHQFVPPQQHPFVPPQQHQFVPPQQHQFVPPQQHPFVPPQQQFSHPPNVQLSPALAALPPDQRQLVQQVLSMSQQQVDLMPPDQRVAILQLRAQFLGQ